MKTLVQPSVVSQFYTLVGEAQYTLNQQLPTDLEHYLVTLMMRFTERTNFLERAIGQCFLEAQLQAIHNPEPLKDVGDSCLLTSGLFPQYKAHHGVPQDYFTSIGQSAFHGYASHTSLSNADLFHDLAVTFPTLVTVLQATRRPSNLQ